MRLPGLAAAVLLAAVPLVPVAAHETDPAVVTVLDAVEPSLPGVTVQVVPGGAAAQLVLANPTPTPLTILGDAGEPFLRVAADGAYANLGSPSWRASNSPGGAAGASGPERFARVSREPSWGWFDHRLHPAAVTLTTEQRASRTPVRLGEWRVPFRYGPTAGELRGHVELRPPLGRLRTRLTGPQPPGVEVVVLDGRVPGLFLRATAPVTVLGAAGEPFARVGPGGAEVNEASPTYVADAQLRGRTPTVPADPAAPPRWLRVGSTPTLSWLDRRLAYREPAPPPEVVSGGRVVALVQWRVPLGSGALSGVTEWVPDRLARDRRPLWPWLAGAGALLVGLAAARRLAGTERRSPAPQVNRT